MATFLRFERADTAGYGLDSLERCNVTSANLALEADGGSIQLVVNLFRATESGLHVVADILRPYHFFKLCLMDEAGWLLACAAQNQGSIAGVQFSGNFFDRE